MQVRKQGKTLRMLMPQWQGGDYDLSVPTGELYPLGARILAFIAPESDAPLVEVPVETFCGSPRTEQNGVLWQDVMLRQLRAARKIIDEYGPDRIITFGGDCLVSQAPFAYLHERYGKKLGVLWLDAHPDISTPNIRDREHSMVLGNLLGRGDALFAREVKTPLAVEQVLVVGVEAYDSKAEGETVEEMGLRVIAPKDVATHSDPVMQWIQANGFEHIAVHFDLDVLDPASFYSQLSMDPDAKPIETTRGKLNLAQVARLLHDLCTSADIVALSFAEHTPWDARNLRHMMEGLPIMK